MVNRLIRNPVVSPLIQAGAVGPGGFFRGKALRRQDTIADMQLQNLKRIERAKLEFAENKDFWDSVDANPPTVISDDDVNPKVLQDLGFSAEQASRVKAIKGKGCETCSNTGYKGRQGIYEILVVSKPLKEAILRKATTPELRQIAVKEGFQTMQTEREREAKEFRAKGAEMAAEITANADKEVTVILANAEKSSQILKGEGDGKRNKIFAEAFGKDPEFFAFYRAMQAYEKALIGGETSLILSPDSEFFKFFGNIKQKQNQQ